MVKITFLGAGGVIFVKNIIGDCMFAATLRGAHIALYDIAGEKLEDAKILLEELNHKLGAGMKISAWCGVEKRKEALRGADFVINAVHVGGYGQAIINDFEIPSKYGIKQTVGDTLGIGGIFRGLRSAPVVLDFCRDMEEVCPDALFMNYTNPMAILMMAVFRGSNVRAVGLCHSVQHCAAELLNHAGRKDYYGNVVSKIAGINHQAWLLELKDGSRDIYPEIKAVIAEKRAAGKLPGHDLVRLDYLKNFGCFTTESSKHGAEYVPWYIKRTHPQLIEQYDIMIDDCLNRCFEGTESWNNRVRAMLYNSRAEHCRSAEYGSYIIEAIVNNEPYTFGGNVMNSGLITNLPVKACVEVPCVADGKGITPLYVGDLPEGCAAVNRTNVNVQILVAEAVLTRRKEYLYQAALLDPHTAAELSANEIIALVDELYAAHGNLMPELN